MNKASAVGALLLLSMPLPAMAQSDPNGSVTANIGGGGNGGYVLYPGGQSGRYVGGLLQPGEKPDAVIHLHMPTHHHVVTAVVRKPRAPKVAAATPPTPPAAPVYQGGPSAMPEDSAGRLVSDGGVAAPPPTPPATKPAKPPRRVANVPSPAATAPAPAPSDASGTVPFSFDPDAASPPAARTAHTTPPPATTGPPPASQAGLKRQTVISFAAGDTSPAPSDVNVIHGLAASLNSALSNGSAKVELEAYGGPRGDKSSDSRRLSLKRALVVRELLIEDGIPSEKIDVRAMGGADSGALDRVDVLLRS